MSAAIRKPTEPDMVRIDDKKDPVELFAQSIIRLAREHPPSQKPFFHRLAALPSESAHDPVMLGQINLVYQAAMHATRVGVYFMPYLDSPALRKRKLRVYIDDDGLPSDDMHHYQLSRAFRGIGAALPLEDEEFGDLDELCSRLDSRTAHFVRLAKSLYSRSLGAWCIVEVLSNEWMHALADALAVHHPQFASEPYFEECFSQGVEERHAAEALEVTQTVLRQRPHLIEDTLRDAQLMADGLDSVWDRLDLVVRDAIWGNRQDVAGETELAGGAPRL